MFIIATTIDNPKTVFPCHSVVCGIMILEFTPERTCPPSSGQNLVPSVYVFPHLTQRGISFSGDTNFEPSSGQNFEPVENVFWHFGQAGVSTNSASRLQPQF